MIVLPNRMLTEGEGGERQQQQPRNQLLVPSGWMQQQGRPPLNPNISYEDLVRLMGEMYGGR